jgi:hypothetical protein
MKDKNMFLYIFNKLIHSKLPFLTTFFTSISRVLWSMANVWGEWTGRN